MDQTDTPKSGLVGKLIYLAMKDGQDNPAACVLAEDAWSITIRFQGVPTIIPRDQIKSIQIKGGC
jgi:hypothetical protein